MAGRPLPPLPGLALLLAASCTGAWGLHVLDHDPRPVKLDDIIEGLGRPPANQSEAYWQDELRFQALLVRTSCASGSYEYCLATSRRLQNHVRDKLLVEAARIGENATMLKRTQPTNGQGLHVRVPRCANASGSREAPDYFYRHVTKNAGYNIIGNLRNFTGLKGVVRTPSADDYMLLKQMIKNHSKSAFTFTFARDPITRFISAYTELEVEDHTGITAYERGTVERAREFIRLLLRGYDNYHISPQVEFHIFHYQEVGRPFDFIGRLEDFDKDWHRLENISGCAGGLSPFNAKFAMHRSSKDPYKTTVAMQGLIKDPHPAAWQNLSADPHAGFDDAISLRVGERRVRDGAGDAEGAELQMDSLAMRDLLLAPDRAALRVICLIYIVDFAALSYPLPPGCEDLRL